MQISNMKMKSWLCFQTWILFYMSSLSWSQQTDHYRILYKWKLVEFDYPTEQDRYNAEQRGDFIPRNVAVVATDYHPRTNRYFISSPSFRSGVPATLSEVTRNGLLKPFPRWPNRQFCEDLFSVYRVHIDKCGLMWVIDAGRYATLENNTLLCTPKLLIYDLNNQDQEILRYEFPWGQFAARSLLLNIITESYQSDCSDSIAYISDPTEPAIVVFDYPRRTSWRIVNKFFYPYPTEGSITTNNLTFDLMDGVMGITLSPAVDYERRLYFSSFASVRQSWVPVAFLKNQTLATNEEVARKVFAVSPGEREGQSVVQVMTDDGILIYSMLTRNAIACWNAATPFTIENQHVLLENDEDLQFISGMKLKNNKLLITSSKLSYFAAGIVDETDFNYRIMIVDDVRRLLLNTPCNLGFARRENNYYYPRPEVSTYQPWSNAYRYNLLYKK